MRIGRREIRGLLIDLDGVLHVGRRPIAGAVDKIAALQALGMPHCYLTNTTTRSVSALSHELSQMGFAIDAGSILSAPMAAKAYLESKHNPRCKLLLRREVLAEFGDCRQSDVGVDVVVMGDIGAACLMSCSTSCFGCSWTARSSSRCIAIASGRPRTASSSTSGLLLRASNTRRENRRPWSASPARRS